MLLFRGDEQEEAIFRVKQRMESDKGKLETEITPYMGLHMAEHRHQKYYLKRFPNAIEKLRTIYPSEGDLANSTLVARQSARS